MAGAAMSRVAVLLSLALVACQPATEAGRGADAVEFPKAQRPVSPPGANGFSDEATRDDRREAATLMELAGIEPGMSVADLGAGDGYYTVRLAERVGKDGRVLAQDIDRDALLRLGNRVERERLDNVSIVLGAPDDPRLPVDSFDRVFMVHMYHEVEAPYAFLWRLRPALREGGQVIVVEVDRPTDRHGIAPQLLFCEFEQVGFRLVEFVRHPALAGYYARFDAVGERPQPEEIEPCRPRIVAGNGAGVQARVGFRQ